MFLLHNDLSSVISTQYRCRFLCMAPIHWLFVPVICFLPCLLTRYRFVSCQQHKRHRFCLLCIYGVLATLNRSLFRFYCIWNCLLTRHWFVSSTCTLRLSCSIILFQWLLLWTSHSFNTFIFHLGTVYLHHFIDCHILYVFGLNSTVCSHIVGVHLSSDQVSYYFMMDADLYNSFLLVCVLKVSTNL